MDRELIEYLPEYMREYKEMKQIMEVEQGQTGVLWEAVERLLKEAFVCDESEVGAARWEAILDIRPKDTDSLEVRNFRIKGRLNEDLPYTVRTLKQVLTALCGEDGFHMEVYPEDYTLKIEVSLTSKKLLWEVCSLAERMTPLNLLLEVTLMYNTHEMLCPYTHLFLKSCRHEELREEVLG